MKKKKLGLFPALLKYWRGQRGMSQLDLALAADVSSRHISFLETGRAQPSEFMILGLASCLEVPLRNQNELLRAAGFDDRFDEPGVDNELSSEINRALDFILSDDNPFPVMLLNQHYDLLRTNRSAQRLLPHFIKDITKVGSPMNIYRLLFNPDLGRESVVAWDKIGQDLLSRLHREALHQPENVKLRNLVNELLEFPGVPPEWRQPSFESATNAAHLIQLRNDNFELSFLTTITSFNAPGNITVEELRIESYYPLDKETERICREFGRK